MSMYLGEHDAHVIAYGYQRPEFVAFMTNKPNPPEHAAFMARAAELYPKLPAGAQQNALHCLETLGKGYAKRYASNALARESANQRHIMGMTLATHRAQQADKLKPYSFEGVASPARHRLYKTVQARYADYMAEQRPIVEARRAKERKAAEAKYAAALAAVSPQQNAAA